MPALTILAILCSASALAKPPVDPANPPAGRFVDEWMAVRMDGQKVGYFHLEQAREGNEILSDTKIYIMLRRDGTEVEVTVTAGQRETLDGHPLSFSSEVLMANQPIRFRGQIRDGRITVTSEQYGQELTQELDYPKGALMSWGVYLETAKHSLEPGTRFKLLVFEPSQALNAGIPTTFEVVGREDIDIGGKRVSGLKVKTTAIVNGVPIDTTSWINDRWQMLRQETSLMGIHIEMLRCDKAGALQGISGAEIFLTMLIPLGQAINRDTAQSITFRIQATGDAEVPVFPETEIQKIVRKTKKEVVLKVSRLDHRALATAQAVAVPKSLEAFLKPSIIISSHDPQVQAMAKRAAAGKQRPYAIAHSLRQQVSKAVKYKGLGTAFGTAAEVCRNKSGDCTEHGVLLAALGRAVGIPSRVVTGMIYVSGTGNHQNALGFHMWTQFWIGGRWVDMDSAWDQTDVDPTHITLATHSLEHASMGGLVSAAMLQFDRFKISVVEVESQR